MSNSSNRYIHSVDGLRAVAVIAVLLYHLGIGWIPGGFLGVDLFLRYLWIRNYGINFGFN